MLATPVAGHGVIAVLAGTPVTDLVRGHEDGRPTHQLGQECVQTFGGVVLDQPGRVVTSAHFLAIGSESVGE